MLPQSGHILNGVAEDVYLYQTVVVRKGVNVGNLVVVHIDIGQGSLKLVVQCDLTSNDNVCIKAFFSSKHFNCRTKLCYLLISDILNNVVYWLWCRREAMSGLFCGL